MATKKKQSKKKAATKKAEKPLSGLAAAAKVLGEANGPLGCKELATRMLAKGYWKTKGKTPAATLYSAIFREIGTKGSGARFKKADKGKFALKK